jgi:hypothetical protein
MNKSQIRRLTQITGNSDLLPDKKLPCYTQQGDLNHFEAVWQAIRLQNLAIASILPILEARQRASSVAR